MVDLRAQILAKLDQWSTADDPSEVYDATLRMHDALRAVITGPDWGDMTPNYLPLPWTYQVVAAELGIDVPKEADRG